MIGKRKLRAFTEKFGTKTCGLIKRYFLLKVFRCFQSIKNPVVDSSLGRMLKKNGICVFEGLVHSSCNALRLQNFTYLLLLYKNFPEKYFCYIWVLSTDRSQCCGKFMFYPWENFKLHPECYYWDMPIIYKCKIKYSKCPVSTGIKITLSVHLKIVFSFCPYMAHISEDTSSFIFRLHLISLCIFYFHWEEMSKRNICCLIFLIPPF